MVQLSHPHVTTGKNIALTIQTFVGKVMSLLFNMLSSLVIAFLPRSNRLLISWLQSPFAVIWEPKKIKSATVSIFSLSCHEMVVEVWKCLINTTVLPLSGHLYSLESIERQTQRKRAKRECKKSSQIVTKLLGNVV